MPVRSTSQGRALVRRARDLHERIGAVQDQRRRQIDAAFWLASRAAARASTVKPPVLETTTREQVTSRWPKAGSWHFFCAWLLVLNGIVHALYGFFSRHLQRELLPNATGQRSVGKSIRSARTVHFIVAWLLLGFVAVPSTCSR
ncbi:MAG: hypothetical protein ABI564_07730 [Ideonella sp.]